jgi:hypothetical protein
MNAHHVKFNIEFDIPIKIEGFELSPMAFELIEKLIFEAVNVQRFYFKKQGEPPYCVRAKNISLSYTKENVDVPII